MAAEQTIRIVTRGQNGELAPATTNTKIPCCGCTRRSASTTAAPISACGAAGLPRADRTDARGEGNRPLRGPRGVRNAHQRVERHTHRPQIPSPLVDVEAFVQFGSKGLICFSQSIFSSSASAWL